MFTSFGGPGAMFSPDPFLNITLFFPPVNLLLQPGSSGWGSDFLEVWRSGDGFAGSIGLEMNFLEYQKIGLARPWIPPVNRCPRVSGVQE